MERVQKARDEFNAKFIEKCEAVIDKALDELPGKIPSARVGEIASAVSVLTEKRNLVLGRPTMITSSPPLDIEAVKQAFYEALAESGLPTKAFLGFVVAQSEAEGDHELARLLPQIITIEPEPEAGD